MTVRLAEICGTDFREIMHGPIAIPQSPHPLTGAATPLTLDREFSGEVVEVGPGVTRVTRGTSDINILVEPNP